MNIIIVLINWLFKNTMRVGDQKLMTDLEWPYGGGHPLPSNITIIAYTKRGKPVFTIKRSFEQLKINVFPIYLIQIS